jgi:hypothetical protein
MKRWSGPHVVERSDGKDVSDHVDQQGRPRSFNSSAVKPALISSTETPDTVFITEVLSPGDLREKRFDSAKRDEILGLINRNTFRLVSRSGEKNPNIVPGRFVLAIKNPGTDKEFLKARFVLGGHRDLEKRSIVHNSTTIKQSSVRLLLALTATLGSTFGP